MIWERDGVVSPQQPRTVARLAALAGSCCLWALLALGAEREGPPTLEAWRDQLLKRATEPRFAQAHWGIHVVSLETGRTLFSANGDKLFIPASTTKLFTGALALDRLGPDFRIRTSVYAAASPDRHGVLKGDLVLFGRGDPSFNVASAGGDLDQALKRLVEPLKATGVKVVTGDLVADESFFRGSHVGSGWEHDDLHWYYGAEASALGLNDNAVDVVIRPASRAGLLAEAFLFPSTRYLSLSNTVRTGPAGAVTRTEVQREKSSKRIGVRGSIAADSRPVTESISVPDPTAWFAWEFRHALERQGITVRGQTRVRDAEEAQDGTNRVDAAVELAGTWSAPLSQLLPRMMKPSQNLQAQLWLLQVGAAQAPSGERNSTSEAAGAQAMAAFVADMGIAAAEVRIHEGSGLSRHNLVTPRALTTLLEVMRRGPHAQVWLDSLPVAGVDGTLRSRMRGTPAERNVRAKTGSLSTVATLAGYLTTAAGEPVVFAFMLNHYAPGSQERLPRAELDDLAVLLAGLRQHSRDVPDVR